MRTKKIFIKASVAAVASVFAASAMATVDLDATTAGNKTFASDLSYVTASPLPAGNTNTDVVTKIGFGVSSGANRYIRLELTNGKFATAFTSAVGHNPVDAIGGAKQAIVQNGAAGDSFVIIQITPNASIPTTDTLTFGMPPLTVTSTASPVTVSYQLHETAVSAVAGSTGSGLLYSKSATLAAMTQGLRFDLTTQSNTATVADLFKKFTSATSIKVGTINYGVVASNPLGKTANTAVTLANLVTTGVITVAGDFSAVNTSSNNGLFLNIPGGSCTSPSGIVAINPVINTAKTSATFTVTTASYTTGLAAADVCYTVTGTTAVPAQTVTAALAVTAPTNSAAASVAAATLGTIVRDGASAVALNIPNSANTDLGYVRISNIGSSAGKVTGTMYAEDGTTLGTANVQLSASLAANSTLVLSVPDLVTQFGVTTWTGRAKLSIVGEIPSASLRVQNLVRTANGTLVDVSGSTHN